MNEVSGSLQFTLQLRHCFKVALPRHTNQHTFSNYMDYPYAFSPSKKKSSSNSMRLAGSTPTKAAFDAHITSFGDYQPGTARWAPILLYVSMLHDGRY